MGIIKAAADAVRGAFADQWLEVIEPGNMGTRLFFLLEFPPAGARIQRGRREWYPTAPGSGYTPTSS